MFSSSMVPYLNPNTLLMRSSITGIEQLLHMTCGLMIHKLKTKQTIPSFLGTPKAGKASLALLIVTQQLPEYAYIALPEDFLFGCFLVLERYGLHLTGFTSCLSLACTLLPVCCQMLLEDGETFVLLGHVDLCAFLRQYCLELIFLVGCLLRPTLVLKTSCSVSPSIA